MFSFLSLNRSSAFQDRQIRNLFTRYYKHRAHFKETMMRYEVEKSKALRRGRHDRAKLDELERREAFIQGRKEHLLMEINERAAQASEGQKRREEDEEKYKEDEMSKSSTTMFGSPPATAKIRRTETVSIFKGRSSFQDSGKLVSFSLLSFILVTLPSLLLSFLNYIGSLSHQSNQTNQTQILRHKREN